MHVEMKRHITGFRQGRPWPAKGGVLEVGDREGARLIQAGYAEEANDEVTTPDAGGRDTDPPGQDGAPSDQPDGDAEGEPGDGDVWPKHVGGPNFELPDGTRVKGKAAAEKAYAAWQEAQG